MLRALSILCLATITTVGSANAQNVDGEAHAKDGDDLIVAGKDIRLFGIDAFEFDQKCEAEGKLYPCGLFAQEQLVHKVFGRSVHCEQRDYDRERNRPVAVCWVGGEELNAWMVSEGWAIAYRKYSMDYVDEEAVAQANKKGVHRGHFIPPWEWRDGTRLPEEKTEVQDCAATECKIKGNIRDGKKTYHLPGQADYENTKINPARGERCFCSEAEAVSAGWSKAKR